MRVGAPLIDASMLLVAILVSAMLWSAGFAIHTLKYWRILNWD